MIAPGGLLSVVPPPPPTLFAIPSVSVYYWVGGGVAKQKK